jgi:signal recognition particle receptor subunit alpha
MRKWGDQAPSESEMASLNYSSAKDESLTDSTVLVDSLIDQSSIGTRSVDGSYEIKNWDFSGSDDTLQWAITGGDAAETQSKAPMGAIGSMFARLTGGKTLSQEDLEPVLSSMKDHLMKKNVAKEIADKICDGVGKTLIGKKISGFQSEWLLLLIRIANERLITAIKTAVRDALSASITQILTPKTSTDILQAIRSKMSSPLPSTAKRSPYSIAFVGVNGVGKSTNLSKVCFWLLQNGFRVLIAACDTFR